MTGQNMQQLHPLAIFGVKDPQDLFISVENLDISR
jgi:hypothetical protein